jgi:hypothetical protein
MADTRAMVRRALDLFKPYLRAFVEKHLRNAYGQGYLERVPRLRQRHEPDIQALLSIMLQHWNDAFAPVLAARDRTLIFELKDVRNRWAHEHEFSLDDAYRGVDTIELLADGVGAGVVKPRLAAMKEEIRLLQATPLNSGAERVPPAPASAGGTPPDPAPPARSGEGHSGADPDVGGLDWLGDRRSPKENPSYAEDALDAHLRVLLRWAERSRDPADAASPEEDVYVWWAKLRSPRRDGALPHAAEIAAIQSQIDDDVETHLYLTDYRSLYVGQLGEVTADAVLEEEGEAEHAPSYYRGREADFWFTCGDLRLPPLGPAAPGGRRHARRDRGPRSPAEHYIARPLEERLGAGRPGA